jgi:hypothetical protein
MYNLIFFQQLTNFCVFDAMTVKADKILNHAKHNHVVDVLIHSFIHSLTIIASYVCHCQVNEEVIT